MAGNSRKISIIGLGLIGGSLARALRERAGISQIAAVDPDTRALGEALKDGSITHGSAVPDETVWNADIIFICTPVKHAMEYIDLLSEKAGAGCIVTDVGSTKSEIINYINSLSSPPCFIGGHPMAGTEKNGYAAGFAHLFENAYYILTPSKSATPGALETLTALIKSIGALPVHLDAEEHDRITGGISHVPHVVASALVNLVQAMDTPAGLMQLLAAGGFKDITRIASSNPGMWENIVRSNKIYVKRILEGYIETLRRFMEHLEEEDGEGIYRFFESAKIYRDSFVSSNKKGLIVPLYELMVDVVDQPGIIGEIATILGNNGINIKNILVSNSREFEQGCLKITLPDSDSVKTAFILLQDKGYKVYKRQ